MPPSKSGGQPQHIAVQVGAADAAAAEAERRAEAALAALAGAAARCQLAERDRAAAHRNVVTLEEQVRAAARHTSVHKIFQG